MPTSELQSQRYPWYQVSPVDELTQGDILFSCPIVLPRTEADLQGGPAKIQADVRVLDVIVMTQACDILNTKVTQFVLCPVFPLDGVIPPTNKKFREELRRGNFVGRLLLNDCSQANFPFHVVDFSQVYSLPREFLLEFARQSRRLRLLPPYREHLAQAFARFFMRVGLPADIPPFAQ